MLKSNLIVMEKLAKLIHKSNLSYLPTKLPVHFYGLPDGKVYLLYSRFYKVGYEKSGIEFVMAVHDEFTYDYAKEQLISHDHASRKFPVYDELVDKPNPKIRILKVFREINSYSEALTRLNSKAQKSKVKMEDGHKLKVVDNGIKSRTASA